MCHTIEDEEIIWRLRPVRPGLQEFDPLVLDETDDEMDDEELLRRIELGRQDFDPLAEIDDEDLWALGLAQSDLEEFGRLMEMDDVEWRVWELAQAERQDVVLMSDEELRAWVLTPSDIEEFDRLAEMDYEEWQA